MDQQSSSPANHTNINELDTTMNSNSNTILNSSTVFNPLKYTPLGKQQLPSNSSNAHPMNIDSVEMSNSIYLSPNFGLIVKINQPITPYIQRIATPIKHKHEFISHIRNKLLCQTIKN
jgi:hypothetical protein